MLLRGMIPMGIPLIDRYIFRTFLKVMLIAFVSLAGLYIVIDAMSNLDELLAFAKTQSGGIARVLVEYYGPRSLVLFDQLAGLLAMASAMLAVTLLQRHQELTALMAAGVSKIRTARPLLVGAVLVSFLGVLNREQLLPRLRDRLAYNAQDLSGQMGRRLHACYDNHSLILFSGAKAFAREQRIEQPVFRLPGEFSLWGKKIEGREAFFVAATAEHPAGYLVRGTTAPQNLAELPSLSLDNAAVLLSPQDHPWLQADECFVVSGLMFQTLVRNTAVRNYFSTPELLAGLRNKSLNYGRDVQVIVHGRFLQPLLDFTLFFLGIPLVLTRENRNIFVAAGLCLGIVTAFMVVTISSQAAGAHYMLAPPLAAWLPLVVFGPVAFSMARPLWD
jgi:lipopolysaccharide export system permease protein